MNDLANYKGCKLHILFIKGNLSSTKRWSIIGEESQGRPTFNTVQGNEMELDSPEYHSALCSTEVATVFYMAESTTVNIHETEIMRISSGTHATTNRVKSRQGVNVTTGRQDKNLRENGSKADVQINKTNLPNNPIHCKDLQMPNLGELSSIESDGENIVSGMSERSVPEPCNNEDSTSATSFSFDSPQENFPTSVTGNDTMFKEKLSGLDHDIKRGKYIDDSFKVGELNNVEIKKEQTETLFSEEESVKKSLAARVVGQASEKRVRSQLNRKYQLVMSASKSKFSFNRQPLASIPVTTAMARSTFNWRGENLALGRKTKAISVRKTHDPKPSCKKGHTAKEDVSQGIVIKTEGEINNFAPPAEDTSQQNNDKVQSPSLNLGAQQIKEKVLSITAGTCVKEKSAFQNRARRSDTELPGGNLALKNKEKSGQWLDDSLNGKEEIGELQGGGSVAKGEDDDIQLPDEMSVVKNKREILKFHGKGAAARSTEEVIELPGKKSHMENEEIIVELPDKLSGRKNDTEKTKLLGPGCNLKNKAEIIELPYGVSETQSTNILAESKSERTNVEKNRTSTEETCDKSSTFKEFNKSLQLTKEITRKLNSTHGVHRSRSFGKSNIVVQSNSGRRIETTVSCQSFNYKQYNGIFKEMLTTPEGFDKKKCGSGLISTIFDKLRLSSLRKDSLTENVSKGGNTQADQSQPKIKQQHHDATLKNIATEVLEVGCERPKSMTLTPWKGIDSKSNTVESQETTTTILNVCQSRTETSPPICGSSTMAPSSPSKAPQHLIDGERKTSTTTSSEMSPPSVEGQPKDGKPQSDDKHNVPTQSSSPSSSTSDVPSSSLTTGEQVESQSDGNASIGTERTKIQVKKRGRPCKGVNRSFRYLKKSNLKPVINLTKASNNSGEVHRDYGIRVQSESKGKFHEEMQDSEFEDPLDTVANRTRAKDTADHNQSKSNIVETTNQSNDEVKQTSSDAKNKENVHEVEKHDYRVKPCFVSIKRIDSGWIKSKIMRNECR